MRYISKSNNYYGHFLILIGLLLLAPLSMLIFYPQEVNSCIYFIIPALVSIVLGYSICSIKPFRHVSNYWRATMHEGSLIVLYAWIIGIILGACPFIISGKLTVIQALFEAVSGWTTTGLSVVRIEEMDHIFQFHRCFMQFCGGLGFIMVILFFVQENQAANLYDAEGHPDRLEPRLIYTVRMIFMIYFTSLFIGTIMYRVAGMSWFDSIFHAMCALSTGGFSTQADSIGAYHSIAIEFITIFLMIIGTTNFAVLVLLIKKDYSKFVKISELRLFVVLSIIFTLVIAFSLSYSMYANVSESLRMGIFNVVSALSTSGFSTCSYQPWPTLAVFCMIILMLIGGGYGSTAGGIKLTRIYIAYKTLGNTFKKKISSKRSISKVYHYRAQGKTEITPALMQENMSYILIYLTLFFIGTGLLSLAASCDLQSAMFEFASSLGTVGLSIGLTGPDTNSFVLIIEMIGMLLGRLEIFVVFIGIISFYHKLKHNVKNH